LAPGDAAKKKATTIEARPSHAWELLMDSSNLEALGAELNARLQHGAFRGLPPVMLEDGRVMEAELMARIVLSDIDDIREWDRTHATHQTDEMRLRTVGMEARRLLGLD
jgi:hypothetical protein